MKILIALSRFPYPILKGDRLRAYYQIRELSKNNELHLICLAEDSEYKSYITEIEKYCKSITVIPHSSFRIAYNLAKGIFNALPFQVNYFLSPQAQRIISEKMMNENFDICFVQLIRMAGNVKPKSGNTLFFLDYMDAFSAGTLKRALKAPFFLRFIWNTEARRLFHYEKKIFSYYEGCAIITEADRTALRLAENEKKQILIVPNGVDERFFAPLNKLVRQDFDIIFTGNMNYFPNIEAACYLSEQILPLLLNQFPALRIGVVGAEPHPRVQKLANRHIVVTGYVNDVRDYLHRAKLFVAPLFFGSGLQNKLLEAMACGLPVVCSPGAGEALGARSEHELFIADSPQSFAEKIAFLLQNPEFAQSIATNGQNFVQKKFGWESVCRTLVHFFEHSAKLRS